MVTYSADLVRPLDAAGVVDVLRAAAGAVGDGDRAAGGASGRAVTIQGAGTKVAWGGPLSPVDVVLSTAELTGVVAHEPGDRVVTVRAGTPLRSLQEVLAASGQRLAIESGYVDATIGGVLACGEAGPLRLRYGSGRDLLIGVEFVRANGVVAHSGGKVVKNVAGYDLGRLLCGSYGTVGVITTATFRLHPLPAASAWVVARVRKGTLLAPSVQQGALPDIVPSAVECDLRGPDAGEVAVLVEGSAVGVAARVRSLRRVLRDAYPDADVVVAQEPPPWWGRYPFGDGDVGLRIAAPVGLVPAILTGLHDHLGGVVAVRGSIGSGLLYAGLPSTVDVVRLAEAVADVRAVLAGSGGTCVVVTAPPAIRDGLDLWGEVAGLALMRRLKEQFDPAGRFAAGRFVGGL
jgi:glycolate oxidase FAD binding subunit